MVSTSLNHPSFRAVIMVKVREDYPMTADGAVDLELWLQRIAARVELQNPDVLRQACLFAKEADEVYDRE
ncbi:MAG TPA: hypothetical protein PKU92_01315, partial [Agitococcus sp.]|nr:hypothetical protein [Agitococcus sp.]